MSLQRTHTAELARLFNATAQPVYLLDEHLKIVFMNRACLEWLGPAAENLVGRRCIYQSTAHGNTPDAVAAGLCPPPQVLSRRIVTASVARLADDGRMLERLARFLPVGSGTEDVWAVIAIVDATDRSPDGSGVQRFPPDALVATPGEPPPEMLHEQIRRFRAEAAARYRADRVIGQGAMMRLARRQVELAAASRSSVLLIGPPGSGRQHLAAAIHYGANPPASAGPSGALVPLDCSLLGADLIEAAVVAIARGTDDTVPGTLLLHRVDELPPDAQLQFFDFFSRRSTTWRLMATATVPLAELARRGKFRSDLAALLSTIVIELPSLAQRREDLPLLAQLFLEDHNAAGPRQIGGFSPSALDRLDAYSWPGNLDELAQVVADAYQRAAGIEIAEADLPERVYLAVQAAAQPRRTEETIVLDEYLSRVERELIRRALARSKGNKARAARLLGVTRPRLYRRMVQLGLDEG